MVHVRRVNRGSGCIGIDLVTRRTSVVSSRRLPMVWPTAGLDVLRKKKPVCPCSESSHGVSIGHYAHLQESGEEEA
jgi:hypothetical protein